MFQNWQIVIGFTDDQLSPKENGEPSIPSAEVEGGESELLQENTVRTAESAEDSKVPEDGNPQITVCVDASDRDEAIAMPSTNDSPPDVLSNHGPVESSKIADDGSGVNQVESAMNQDPSQVSMSVCVCTVVAWYLQLL